MIRPLVSALALIMPLVCSSAGAATMDLPPKTTYRTAEVAGQTIFYREAGDLAKPTIVLLHGFPSSSHQFRELIPLLSPHYHVIAPDNLGSGYSAHPDPDVTPYTFDRLAGSMAGLLDSLSLKKYSLYMHDFGAPVGFRLIERRPEAVEALIIQNANAYLDGLSPERQAFFRKAHDDRGAETLSILYDRVSRAGVVDKQYLRDVPPEKRDGVSPDSWTHDLAFLATDTDKKIQVQLFQDYQTNIDRYPLWQTLMRAHQYPALIVWGEKDPAFIAPGAKAYLRDLPNAELHLLDAGHFALEEQPNVIAGFILDFMARHSAPQQN